MPAKSSVNKWRIVKSTAPPEFIGIKGALVGWPLPEVPTVKYLIHKKTILEVVSCSHLQLQGM